MHKHFNFENKQAKQAPLKNQIKVSSKRSELNKNFVAQKLDKNRQNRKLHSKTSSSNFYQYFSPSTFRVGIYILVNQFFIYLARRQKCRTLLLLPVDLCWMNRFTMRWKFNSFMIHKSARRDAAASVWPAWMELMRVKWQIFCVCMEKANSATSFVVSAFDWNSFVGLADCPSKYDKSLNKFYAFLKLVWVITKE